MANVTEIEFSVPTQPNWTHADVDNFTKAVKWGGRKTGRGPKLSWLAHNHALQWYHHRP